MILPDRVYGKIVYRFRGFDRDDSAMLVRLSIVNREIDQLGSIYYDYSKGLPSGRFCIRVDEIITDLHELKADYEILYSGMGK